MQLLLESGADVNRARRKDGSTALMAAAYYGREDNVESLLAAGANSAAADHRGRTAAHVVSAYMKEGGAEACLEMLLCAGASPAAVNADGATPLDVSISEGHGALAAPLLLAYGSPPPAGEGGLAAVARALPAAIAVAWRQVEALQSASTLSDAAGLLREQLSVAAGTECPFARLRVLRTRGALPWEAAWKHAPAGQPLQRLRFCAEVDRLAWAQAVLAATQQAEPVAAERSITVLQQLSGAPRGSREREKLVYAAALCVAKWVDISQMALVEALQELRAAEAGLAAARAQGEATVARLTEYQLPQQQGQEEEQEQEGSQRSRNQAATSVVGVSSSASCYYSVLRCLTDSI